MTKQELIDAVAVNPRVNGVKKDDVSDVLHATVDIIGHALATGDEVIWRGFGRLYLKRRAAKTACNISAGKSLVIPEHSVVLFKPGKELTANVKNQEPRK